jgi:hypothetical protein
VEILVIGKAIYLSGISKQILYVGKIRHIPCRGPFSYTLFVAQEFFSHACDCGIFPDGLVLIYGLNSAMFRLAKGSQRTCLCGWLCLSWTSPPVLPSALHPSCQSVFTIAIYQWIQQSLSFHSLSRNVKTNGFLFLDRACDKT